MCTWRALTAPCTDVAPAPCREIRAHIAEPFWYIHVMYRAPAGQQCTFHWRRGHIFDHPVATVLYEQCVQSPTAKITKVCTLQ